MGVIILYALIVLVAEIVKYCCCRGDFDYDNFDYRKRVIIRMKVMQIHFVGMKKNHFVNHHPMV